MRGIRVGICGLPEKNQILYEEILTPRPCSHEITPKLNENLLRRDFFYSPRLLPPTTSHLISEGK
jgi:hypothetical protein